MMSGLDVRDLSIDFDVYDGRRRALDRVTLSVGRGEIVGILGESGCGKSVLARAIIGLIAPPGRIVQGQICFQGADLAALHEREWQHIRGKRISLLVSNARAQLNPLISVGSQIENVIRGADKSLSRTDRRERVVTILANVGIPDPRRRFDALPHEFSGGMCQRVVIAMALVNSPELLVADEPTSGLDVTVQRQILDLMRQLVDGSGASVVITTRDPGVVAHYCEKAVVMRSGQVVEAADVHTFFRRPRHAYSRSLLSKAVAAQAGGVSPSEVTRLV